MLIRNIYVLGKVNTENQRLNQEKKVKHKPTIEYIETEAYLKFRKEVNNPGKNPKGETWYTSKFNDKGQQCMFFGCGLKGCTLVNKEKAGGFYSEDAEFMSWEDIEKEFTSLKHISPLVKVSNNVPDMEETMRKALLWDEANKELDSILFDLEGVTA